METKKCNKCGEAKELKEFSKRKNKIESICKKCNNDKLKLWQKNNTEKVIKWSLTYKKNNPEKLKESKRKYKKNNPEKLKEINTNQCKYIKTNYAKALLRSSGFTTEQINENPELIEVKKLIIKTKRLCKTSQTSEKV